MFGGDLPLDGRRQVLLRGSIINQVPASSPPPRLSPASSAPFKPSFNPSCFDLTLIPGFPLEELNSGEGR